MDGAGCPKEELYRREANMKTSDADARERVKNSPCEEPKANKDRVSRRMRAAQVLVEQDKRDGLCDGTDEDRESKELYISDCAALDDGVDALLDEIINQEESSGRNAA